MTHPTRIVRIDGAGKQALETGRTRLLVAGAVFALAFATIGGRLVDITIGGSAPAPRLAQHSHDAAPVVQRADIVDRNGVLLATSLPAAGLYADARRIDDPADAARQLAGVLPHLDVADVAGKLASGRSFVWLDRTLTPRQQHAVNALGIVGLEFEPTERRVYPQGRLAVHVLGATDVDNKGLKGVERRFDETLSKGGDALALSIDIRVQHVLADELRRAMQTFEAVGAAGTVMDARSGEVLAMVSFPDYEPKDIGAADADSRFNRITLGVYELGSTFKLFNTAMALDSGAVRLESRYDATRPLRVARFAIRDFKPQARWLSVAEILLHSSNIGSAQMALDVGGRAQRDFLAGLGMLSPLPVELPEVGDPLYPAPWRDINTMTISFGHGIAVSPLHLAGGVAAVVNGGRYNPPTLLRREADVATGTRVIRPDTSATMRKLMRAVVSDGTGGNAKAHGFRVGGKTGTAEKQRGGRYARKSLISSFVAAFPMDDPQYVVFALLDEPKGNKQTFGYATGGWVAAPVAGATIRRIAPMLGVTPRQEDDPQVIEALHLDLPGAEGAPGREVRHRKPAPTETGPQLASF